MKRLQSSLLALALALGLTLPCHAGQTCTEEPQSATQIAEGMKLAQLTSERLDASGAQVVLLARAGQNLTEYGLRWSHLGFAYKTEAGPWRVLHKLNECGSANGAIFRQGLGEFFMDRPWRYEAAYVVLSPELQQALLPLLRAEGRGRVLALNEPRYNMLAYPWSQRFQQSNQWALETLAMAASPEQVWNRATAQDWLRRRGYPPTVLHLSAMKRLGAETTRANISFSDHPNAERFSGRIATTTVDSIFAWLPQAGLGGEPSTIAR
ncbi:DUF2145 domain-containing protein [Paucibacter sp. R3-3]|uniref:DUF2145 domain-containing protein n=1 Tax=Roseateles agri TaxID=3098619 RepID=A0ABU5DEL2_9BURK|nr:DUF2145 domain-containing protein [Paucibacter sp. R3-3]MDY0744715.1 DUF2145 domain-containing protein [Paucibacter sp. R3-3]